MFQADVSNQYAKPEISSQTHISKSCLRWKNDQGQAVLFERRAARVLLVENLPAAYIESIRKAVWHAGE